MTCSRAGRHETGGDASDKSLITGPYREEGGADAQRIHLLPLIQ